MMSEKTWTCSSWVGVPTAGQLPGRARLVDEVLKHPSTVVVVFPEYAGPTNHPDRDLVP